MKNICLIFQIHLPVRLKKYRFLDIGRDDYYYDDIENERITRKIADECYLPANEVLLKLISKHRGNFKAAFSISGTAIDLFTLYAPEVIESFQRLSATGCVEFLAETYYHSLSSVKDEDEFRSQVEAHSRKIEELFGQRPRIFKNTKLIYSDYIGAMISKMGFKAVIAEGARHILRRRSPNNLYCNSIRPELKILLRNIQLSNDISFRLSNPDWTGWPTTANNYLGLLNKIPAEEEIVNLFIDYDKAGYGQMKGNGIFNFLRSFPQSVFEMTEYGFMTPSEIVCYYQPVEALDIPGTISIAPHEQDLTSFLDNELQQEALKKLYGLKDKLDSYSDPDLIKDWKYLQTSDHFFYMSSNFFSHREYPFDQSPYDNPYEAFMNYMNVLNDFTNRLNRPISSINADYVINKMRPSVAV